MYHYAHKYIRDTCLPKKTTIFCFSKHHPRSFQPSDYCYIEPFPTPDYSHPPPFIRYSRVALHPQSSYSPSNKSLINFQIFIPIKLKSLTARSSKFAIRIKLGAECESAVRNFIRCKLRKFRKISKRGRLVQ